MRLDVSIRKLVEIWPTHCLRVSCIEKPLIRGVFVTFPGYHWKAICLFCVTGINPSSRAAEYECIGTSRMQRLLFVRFRKPVVPLVLSVSPCFSPRLVLSFSAMGSFRSGPTLNGFFFVRTRPSSIPCSITLDQSPCEDVRLRN